MGYVSSEVNINNLHTFMFSSIEILIKNTSNFQIDLFDRLMRLISTTHPGQRLPGNNGNLKVLHSPQSSRTDVA